MRRRLIVVAAAIAFMVTVAFLAPLVVLVRTVARDRAITSAERDANVVVPVLAVTVKVADVANAIAITDAGRDDRLTVVLASGEEIGVSIPHDDDLLLAQRGNSFSASHSGGIAVFVSVLTGTGTSVVRVWVPDALLADGVNRATGILVALGVASVVGAIVVGDRLGASLVRPIRHLAGAAERLGGGDLTQRVEPDGPAEVAAVGQAFNLLAGRVGELLAAERELVADLSHRLRTPLTVLRLEADAVGDPDARERLRSATDELEGAVTAIISEARRPITADVGARGDVAAITAGRVAFCSALAEDQGRHFDADLVDGPIVVGVSEGDIEAALDALLGNVFEHTPDATAFAVTLRRNSHGGAELTVDDAGPGITTDSVERGRSGGGSTGLGLDIARRTAEAAGGALRIERSELGGASHLADAPELAEVRVRRKIENGQPSLPGPP